MPFNGSGTFNRVYNWVNDANNSINITASRVDTEDNGFATGLSNCLCKDGQQTWAANQNAGANKITNLVNGSASGDSATVGQVVLVSGANAMTGALNEINGTDIASAGTINLTTATGNYVQVTGTTPITAITLAVGARRVVKFTGILTLTNNAAIILPGGANITTAAGDTAEFWGVSTGVICTRYTFASGQVLATVTVPNGGTGLTTLTAHGLLLGEGTSNIGNTGAGGSAQVLLGQGAADPTWNTLSGLFSLNSSGVASINAQTVALTAISAVNNNTILGNNSGGSASPSALTAAQTNTLLGFVTSGVGGTSGTITLPGGCIIQWGDIGSQTAGATGTVNFTTTYSSGCIVVGPYPITAAGTTTFVHLTSAPGTGSFSWKNESQNITGAGWIAIGK